MAVTRYRRALVGAVSAAILVAAAAGQAQAPPTPLTSAGDGRAAALWMAFDADKDGSVTRAEMKSAFGTWYDKAATAKGGSVTTAQLGPVLNTALAPPVPGPASTTGAAAGRAAGPAVAPSAPACGGRGNLPTVGQTACPDDIAKMMAALPASAPATPAQARKVLVLGNARGYVHGAIPLAAKTIEELGNKTGAWTTTISYDPADINTKNLEQYDALFLSNTTGCFLDAKTNEPPSPKADVDARQAALIAFVRGGKGLAGIHATGDSYHGPCANDPGAGAGRGGRGGGNVNSPGATLAAVVLRWSWAVNDKKLQANDLRLTKADMAAVSDAMYDQLDPSKGGRIDQQTFTTGIVPLITQSDEYVGRPGRDTGRGSWPAWNTMIGGWFKFHWLDPQKITVKVDDKASPLTRMFNGEDFEINDETYTFGITSFSRKNVHVLTSINYDKMTFIDKLKESNPRPDHDFGLSWIKRDGKGRVFYMALGHAERVYASTPMLEHMLAGMQYALGDLQADDRPSQR